MEQKGDNIATIILNESTNAKKFDSDSIIYKKQFKSVISTINSFVENDLESEYAHNTITLIGTRGSGKTSFLLSIRERLKNSNEIKVLRIIDPTLIEEKGHVFLNLISSVCDLVKEHFSSCKCNPDKFDKEIESQWKKSVTRLAAGLPSIDHLSRDSEFVWQDPEYVMENELRAVEAAQNLSDNFKKFLNISLEILDKEAFLVLFDDIDVDSSKGYAVLETIRKYFTTGRVITVLSGDFKLYNLLIRQNKWKNFGAEIIRYEASQEYRANSNDSRINYYDDMVTDLTSQYLLKIMQPQYRYQLDTVYSTLNSTKKLRIDVQVDKKGTSLSLEKILQNVFSQLGINNGYQLESQKHFLLNQPLRTIVHFLQRMIVYITDERVDINDNVNIVSVLLADLYEKNINIESIVNSPKFINIEILKLLVRDGQLKELYQLSPTSSDNSLNAGVFSLNILFSTAIKKYRFLIFDYLVRISYLRNIISYYPDGYSLKSGLVKESGVMNDLVLRDIMNTLQVYHFSAKNKQNNVVSLISLPGLKKISKKSGLDSRLDAILDNKDVSSAQRVIGYIPCLAGEYLYSNQSELFYSFYTLLSAIGELLKRYDLSVDKDTNLELAFSELSQIRYYSMQEEAPSDNTGDEDENEDETVSSERKNEDIIVLSKVVNEWMEDFNENRLSIHQLGKSFTRFYVGLSNLMKSHNEKKLGKLFHLCVINFMNSILIEDVRENLSTGASQVLDLNHSNMVKSESIFLANLSKVIESKTDYSVKLKFSKWIMKCPLIIAYLDVSKTDLIEKLKEFTLCSYSLYASFNVFELLEEVLLQTKKEGGSSKGGKPAKWKSDVSYIKKSKRNDLIKLLEDDGFDMELFKDLGSTKNGLNNGLIRERLPFLQESDHIRNFRNHLKDIKYFEER
ncbi:MULTISPECIES: P-loop NTPase fold protein [Sphingobacterium]|uniref:P-loop NTPase fold protein n=1 Tax=Sphingobacterium TaxID=28453 RepID=UPI00257A3FCD|nr:MULTISPECIES: P-loop NTPase fold protein [Sphingobacterium]